METNREMPKQDKVIAPEASSTENKELSEKAQELAKSTKQEGIVNMLLGQRLSREFPPSVSAYIQGDCVENSSRKEKGLMWVSDDMGYLSDLLPPYGLIPADDPTLTNYGYHALASKTAYTPNCQIWLVSPYQPPMKREWADVAETVRTKKFGFIPVTETHTTKAMRKTDIPLSYDGKKGESGWTQYDYYMRRYDKGENRQGGSLSILSVAVPPHIAAQIDAEAAKNIGFPDALLKALYPNYIGPDIDRNLKRFPATELRTIDCRKTPPKDSIQKYPKALPY